MGWMYLISGSLCIISCISLYAAIKFGKSSTRGNDRSSLDFLVLLLLFALIFVLYYMLFFQIKIFACSVLAFGALTTFFIFVGSPIERRKEKLWMWPLMFLAFSVLAPVTIPIMIATIHFDLDRGVK